MKATRKRMAESLKIAKMSGASAYRQIPITFLLGPSAGASERESCMLCVALVLHRPPQVPTGECVAAGSGGLVFAPGSSGCTPRGKKSPSE